MEIRRVKPAYIAVMYLFPVLYILNSFMPWSTGLWVDGDRIFYMAFWASVIVLHWTSAILAVWFLRRSGMTFKDIGLSINAAGAPVFLGLLMAASFVFYIFTEVSLHHVPPDETKLKELSMAYPVTSQQRLLWILCAFSTGICEEVVYRGFNICALATQGLNRWLAMIVAVIPFIFVHGPIAVSSAGAFGGYAVAGLALGVLFLLTKRLWIPICVHILYNLVAMMAIFQCAV